MNRKIALVLAGFASLLGGTAAAQAKWVAVAVNGHGRWAYAVGEPDKVTAVGKAVRDCGDGCELRGVAEEPCFAIAESHAGGYWYGVALGSNIDFVTSHAENFCASGAPPNSCAVNKAECR